MKKSLIALAVAGAFAAPSAMAVEFTPTLYQSLAWSFNSETVDGSKTGADGGTSIRSGGGSTIGFKFTDDLGNGMTAEAYVHITTSIPSGGQFDFQGRNGYVGLMGNFGSVKMGANEHVYEVGQIIDGWGADWFGGNSVGFWDASPTRLGLSGFNFTRQDLGSLWWTSPNWGGFVLDAAFINGPGGAVVGVTTNDAEGYQLAGKWSNAAFMVSAALATYTGYGQDNFFSTGVLGSDTTQFGGGFTGDESGTVDADGLRITFVWTAGWGNLGASTNIMSAEQTDATVHGIALENEVTTYSFTATFNLASGRIIGNYVQADDQDLGGVSVPDSGATGFDIGYQHDLSASSYAFVRWEQNEADANYQVDGDGNSLGKTDSDSLMIGLKVSY